MRTRSAWLSVPLLFALLFQLSCRSRPRIPVVEQTNMAMGTFFTIAIYGDVDADSARAAIAAAFDTIRVVENHTSTNLPESDIARLNRHSGKDFVALWDDLASMLRMATQVSKASGGAFDVTIGAETALWGFEDQPLKPPDSSAVDSCLRLVNYRDLVLEDNRAKLARPGMRVDLGGVAKGWAVDRVFDWLLARGYRDVMVDGGGDFHVASTALTAGQRHVWVRHPRARGQYFARFKLDNGAVATSGDYERFFIWKGVRYHHILDPATGWPARRAVSVTVVGPSTALCDAWATAVFVLGPEEGLRRIRQQKGLEALVVSADSTGLWWTATDSLAQRLEVLDENARFKKVN